MRVLKVASTSENLENVKFVAISKRKRPKRYATDLNARKWNLIRERLPAALPGGRPIKANLRKILSTVFYVVRSGCA